MGNPKLGAGLNTYYSESHEWVAVEGSIGVVGITAHAKNELGEIVYIELPKVGSYVNGGDPVSVLESTKAAVDIYAPVSGEIIEINETIKDTPTTIQGSSKSSWLFKIKLSDESELNQLLSFTEYESLN